MSSTKKWLPWAFIGLACILLAPTLVFGVREAHDSKFHLMLFLSWRDALELGTLYPRWLPDQLNGLGSPALLIYPPLASAFFALVDLLTLHTLPPERLIGIGALLLAMASGVAFYRWARSYASARPALMAALFYAIAPYHLNLDLYARGAMAEYTTFVWIPLIFLGIRRTIVTGSAAGAALLATGAAALFLTHLLTAMLVAPLALAYVVMCLRTELSAGLRIGRFALVAVTAILGVGLAAFYYVPALSLLPEANASVLSSDVASSNILFGLRMPIDRFQVKLLLIACAYLGFFLYLLAETWNQRKQRAPGAAPTLALMWIACGILCFALMSGLFAFVFRPPSPYAQVQFGWRLLVVMEFSVISLFVCVAGGAAQAPGRARMLKVGAIVALALGAAQSLDILARFHNVAVFAHPLMETTIVQQRLAPLEYFPAGTTRDQKVEVAIKPFERYASSGQPAFMTPGLAMAKETGRIVSVKRTGAQFTVQSVLAAPTPVTIQQFYFPGWKAVDEHGVDIAVFRDETSRLASYVAPAGEHTVVVERRQTRPEHWGNVVSLAALVLLALELGFLLRRPRASLPIGQPAGLVRANVES